MADAPARLSRAEQREQTRSRLITAAISLFNSQGIAATSIEEISEAAGFSRGAFYSNFDDKDALVLAVLDQHTAQGAEQLQQLLEVRTDATNLFELMREREMDKSRATLGLEFVLYAMRNPTARPLLADAMARSRTQTQTILADLWGDAADIPGGTDYASRILEALDYGIDMLRLIDPEAYPLGMFSETSELLFAAAQALVERDG